MITIEYDNVKDKFWFSKESELIKTIYGEYSAIEFLKTQTKFYHEICESIIHEAMNDGVAIIE